MTPRDLPHRPDVARLRRLGAHAAPGAALAAVRSDPTAGPHVVARVQAAASGLRDRLGAAWATGEEVPDVARLLTAGRDVAAAWATAATGVADESGPETVDLAAALARSALWPCVLAAWAGGPSAADALAAARGLQGALDATSPAATALLPGVAQLCAALAGQPGDAAHDPIAAIEDYRAWVADPGTPVAAAALHEHVPALLRAAVVGDDGAYAELAARRRRHHEGRAARRRQDPGMALDLLAVVVATTAHRHGRSPAAQLPYAPIVLPGDAS